MSIIPPNTPNLNPGNMHGGPFTTSTVGAVANGGNTQYGATGGSAASLAGKGLYSVTGDSGPSAVHKPMSGGARRRKHSRKHRRSHSSKKYARKRSLKYRIKHRRSHRHSHSKKVRGVRRQHGGYHQYMGNTPFTLGFRTPGFNLAPNMSALANPAPFMPYNSLTGGR
uniref:Uncharacterized protein n=1 Tax=viral metagenome TaxID=1070528 RepID=A0A6C0EXH5_9ZZZZ